MTQCECGCGNTYPSKHMVVRTSGDNREILYIPHALEVWGFFLPVTEIRKKLETSNLTDFLYIFPDEPMYLILRHPEIYDRFMGKSPWNKCNVNGDIFYWYKINGSI